MVPKENIEPPKERIDSSTGWLMSATALGYDLFQVSLTVLAPLISPIVSLTFWVWLKVRGVSIINNKERLALMSGGFFVELIPIIDILPAWTLTIFFTVKLTQKKDREKIKKFYKNIAGAGARKKRYNVQTVTRETANDNLNPQEFKEAA